MPAGPPSVPATSRAPSTWTSSATSRCRSRRHRADTPCPRPRHSPRRSRVSASATTRASSVTTPGRARSPRASGGCCAGSDTTRLPCSTAVSRPGLPKAGRSRPRRRRRAGHASCRVRVQNMVLDTEGVDARACRRRDARRRARRGALRRHSRSRSTRWRATCRAPSTCPSSRTSTPAAASARQRSSRTCGARARAPRPGRAPICMCGSGVTACQGLLALEAAGIPGGRLYAGSWSEWIRDPARPVARGTT